MRVAEPARRLDGFWGRVDARHIALIGEWVTGPEVLDVGCGYGTLTAALDGRPGVACTGIDNDPAVIEVARARQPRGTFLVEDAARLPFDDGTFDTVVLRDVLHHLVNAPDWDAAASELLRVLRPSGRIVVLDPNVHLLLRAARLAARHEDEECTLPRARAILADLGFRERHVGFNTLFTLPLSGGYVGPVLVPERRPRLHAQLLDAEARLEPLLARLGVLPRVSWRYLIAADRS